MERFIFSSIRANLAFLVLLALIPATAILVFSGLSQRDRIVHEAREDLYLLSHSVVQGQKEFAKSTEHVLSTLALLPNIKSCKDQNCQQVLRTVSEANKEYHHVSLTDLTGNVVASPNPINNQNLAGRKHFLRALERKGFAPGERIVTRDEHKIPAFPFAYLVFDEDDNPIGVLTAVIKLSAFRKVFDVSRFPDGSFLLVTDVNGQSIFQYPEETTFSANQLLGQDESLNLQFVSHGDHVDSAFSKSSVNGERYLVVREPVGLNSYQKPYMQVYVGLPEAAILAPANTALKTSLSIMALVAVLSFLAAWFLGKQAFLSPIRNLLAATERFSKGELGFCSLQSDKPVEFRTLSNSFYRMAENLEIGYQATKAEEERFRLLVEGAPDAIFVATEGALSYVNSETVELFGAESAHDLLGTPIKDRFHPDIRDTACQRLRRLVEEKISAPLTRKVCLRLDGSPVDVEYSAVPMEYQGQTSALVFMRDISERVETEKSHKDLEEQLYQMQKIESVGLLAGGVAHDYNNMLGVILGNAEMGLMETEPTDSRYEYFTEIQAAAGRSRDITRQLLAFARKQTISPQVLDLNQTIDNMLKILRRLLGEDIDLVWSPTKDLWPVKIDPSQLDQILANLCINARDAMDEFGKLTIETGRICLDQQYCEDHAGFIPGDFVMLTVSDNGCGMDKETLGKIFDPFFTTKPLGVGTGLGLSTVYGAVKQSGGFINVYSEPGRGTTFRIYFPRHKTKDEIMSSEIEETSESGSGETILVVEDEKVLLKMTRRMLEPFGYQVLTAESPTEAINVMESHSGKIDLLMTDVVMPEMHGRELAEKLQAQHPDLQCLFMSGYTADVIGHHGVLEEGVHFIQKPFSRNELGRIVRKILMEDHR